MYESLLSGSLEEEKMDKFKDYFMCPKVDYQSTKGIFLTLLWREAELHLK
jgi:hypothetical protein